MKERNISDKKQFSERVNTMGNDQFLNNVDNDNDNEIVNISSSSVSKEEIDQGKLDDSNLTDDFVIGQDFFIDSSEADSIAEDVGQGKQKKKGKKVSTGRSCLTSMIWMAAIFVIAITAAVAIIYFATDYLGVSFAEDASNEKEIVVEKGSSAKEVAEMLEDAGLIKSSLFFRIYAKGAGHDSEFQYGVYYFSKDDSYEDIAEALTKKGALADEVKVTIVEGWTVDKIAKKLAEVGICTEQEFKKAVNEADYSKYQYEFMKGIATEEDGVHYRLEGYLFPDTYYFYKTGNKEGAEQAINKMLQNFDKKLTDEMLFKADKMGYSMHDILTLASIIEMEASVANYEDKQRVSAVFWNRINNWEERAYLQSDPTTKYAYNTSKYDTYKIVGLAPGAYCSPSIDSINAALNPHEECEAYFFVTDKDMNFYFTNTNSEHNKIINKLKKEGKWA